MLMARQAWLLLLCATLLGCGSGAAARVPNSPEQVQVAAFGLRFRVSASPLPRPPGWGVRVRVEVQNPGDAAQMLPGKPIVLSGVFGSLREDGGFDERGGGFAEAPLAQPGSLVVPAKGTVMVERVYPEGSARRLTSPGEALLLSVTILRPLGIDAGSTQQDLAEVLIGIPSSSAPPLVHVSAPSPEAP
jgi:hypothetical protein